MYTFIAAPISADGNDRNRVSVTVCTESGLLAGSSCTSTAREEFLIGEQPMRRCSIDHGAEKAADGDRRPTATPAAATDPKAPDQPAAPTTPDTGGN
jgi:hypothetical protein